MPYLINEFVVDDVAGRVEDGFAHGARAPPEELLRLVGDMAVLHADERRHEGGASFLAASPKATFHWLVRRRSAPAQANGQAAAYCCVSSCGKSVCQDLDAASVWFHGDGELLTIPSSTREQNGCGLNLYQEPIIWGHFFEQAIAHCRDLLDPLVPPRVSSACHATGKKALRELGPYQCGSYETGA